MKIQYLGTGAAEGIPALFCSCALCEHARGEGGRDVRTRSGALVDDVLKIDLPPDTYHHILTYKMDITGLRHLLITHPHEDHYAYAELSYRTRGFGQLKAEDGRLTVYGGKEVGERFHERVGGCPGWEDLLAFEKLTAYVKKRVGNYEVLPLPARHAKQFECFIYLIEGNGKRFLYAHDTGQFYEEVYEALSGAEIDLVSLDLTYMNGGSAEDIENGHMGLSAARRVRERLEKCGAATGETTFVVNHFSHNGGLTHAQLDEAADGFVVSYDGLSIEV